MRPGPYSESPADELAALRGAIAAYLDARDEARPLDEADARRRLDALLGRAPRRTGASAARRFGLGGGIGTRGGEG